MTDTLVAMAIVAIVAIVAMVAIIFGKRLRAYVHHGVNAVGIDITEEP